jgi:fibronectin type 3 domain-containing protein
MRPVSWRSYRKFLFTYKNREISYVTSHLHSMLRVSRSRGLIRTGRQRILCTPKRSRAAGTFKRNGAGLLTFALLLDCWIFAPIAVAQDPATVGQWSAVMTWPNEAVHAHVLPTGKVMFWTKTGSQTGPNNAQLWDPSTNALTPLPNAGINIFCTGHAFLPDGRLLVTGGHITSYVGLPDAYTYDPLENSWTRLPGMNNGRWYPTNTMLPNGDMLVLSGQINTTLGMNPLPQVWDRLTGAWRGLTTAELSLPYYPYAFVAPNGKIFIAGPAPATRYLDTSGTGSWSLVANTRYGRRNWASSVMFDIGKVLVMGGTTCAFYTSSCTSAPTNTAEVIDLTNSTPTWSYVAPMAGPRKLHNATLLPDGKVLVTGGSRGTESPNVDSSNRAYESEMWDPDTNTWTTLASLSVFRGYHSIALLLPDGRVLSAGGDFGGASAEVYSPPYLFKGARPTISSVPAIIPYGLSFVVATPDAASIVAATLIGLSSVTHGFNQSQSIVRLPLAQAPGGLSLTAPADKNLAPPGYYMLFLLNSIGVPSVAQIVRLGDAIPAAPVGLTGIANGDQIDLAWTGIGGNEQGFRIERSADSKLFTLMATAGATSTSYSDTNLAGSTTYYYRVRAFNTAGDSASSNVASATTPSGSLPAPPTNLMATAASATAVKLSWADNSSTETGFNVERSVDNITFTQIAQLGANATTFTDSGLSAGTTYFYRVRAYSTAGSSSYSNAAAVTTPAPPSPPTNLKLTVDAARLTNLQWIDNSNDESSSNNETGFQVERSTDGATFAVIVTTRANVTSYRDKKLKAGQRYYYRVCAVNAYGTSAYSNTVTYLAH